MSRAKKIVFGLVGLVVLLIVAAVVYGMVQVRRPFPTTDGEITVSGLKGTVNVYRDEFGVPHIYAENRDDLYFAQGYVHAQDRFWQMEFWRHVGQGRISEIAGASTIDSDKFIRTMGWNRIAESHLAYFEAEEPEYMAILDAYSAGVNAYLDENRDALSLNFTLMGLAREPWEIEPWTPLNTISWGVVMADDLSGNWSYEVRRANWIKELGEATTANLQPFYPYDERPVIAPTDEQANTIGAKATADQIDWSRVDTNVIERPASGFALGGEGFVGSNNWVVHGDHTDTGMPLLANDPHLGIQMPSIWYEVGLHAPDMDVVGFSFAGTPGVVIGHNAHIAWGVTNANPDVQDLFIEKINPNNPRQYEFEGEWRDMAVFEEVIKVNGGEDVVIEVFETHHGPIINEVVDNQADKLAIQWTAQEPSRILQSVILLNEAENYEDFREALRFWDVPAQNIVYADVEGNIAYQLPGLMPIRTGDSGIVPVPGWTGEHEWDGWIPYEELPAMLNPDSGFIVTANHAIVDEDYPHYIDVYWADGDRGQRITQMIEEKMADGEITTVHFAEIQSDAKSLRAERYLPLLANLSSGDATVQAAIERLRGWDRQLRSDSVPAALFEIFYMHLVENVLLDDVGEEQWRRIHSSVFFHQLADQPDAIWWDDATTSEAETQTDIIMQSLVETVDWFDENVGGEMNEWTWGTIHTATFVSNPLGQSGIGPVENIVNRGPIPVDGGSSTVNANSWSWGNPSAVRGHVSMRMIVDMSDFEASQTVMPTGQSGHPYHPNYDDMMPLWQNGEYHPMRFGREVVEETAVNHLILLPASGE